MRKQKKSSAVLAGEMPKSGFAFQVVGEGIGVSVGWFMGCLGLRGVVMGIGACNDRSRVAGAPRSIVA